MPPESDAFDALIGAAPLRRDAMDALLGDAPAEDLETEHAEVVTKLETILTQERTALYERMQFGYFVPIVFASQAQADTFLAASTWQGCVEHDEHGFRLNGVALAKQIGIPLPKPLASYRAKTVDPTWVEQVGIIGGGDQR